MAIATESLIILKRLANPQRQVGVNIYLYIFS